MATSLLGLLQAGKVPLRELLDMAKGPREDDVYASRETCTEVLRRLAGFCEQLIAESQGKSDLGAAVWDLERRFKNWQELEAEKAQEYARYACGIDGVRDGISGVRSDVARLSYKLDRLTKRLQEKVPDMSDFDDEDDW